MKFWRPIQRRWDWRTSGWVRCHLKRPYIYGPASLFPHSIFAKSPPRHHFIRNPKWILMVLSRSFTAGTEVPDQPSPTWRPSEQGQPSCFLSERKHPFPICVVRRLHVLCLSWFLIFWCVVYLLGNAGSRLGIEPAPPQRPAGSLNTLQHKRNSGIFLI